MIFDNLPEVLIGYICTFVPCRTTSDVEILFAFMLVLNNLRSIHEPWECPWWFTGIAKSKRDQKYEILYQGYHIMLVASQKEKPHPLSVFTHDPLARLNLTAGSYNNSMVKQRYTHTCSIELCVLNGIPTCWRWNLWRDIDMDDRKFTVFNVYTSKSVHITVPYHYKKTKVWRIDSTPDRHYTPNDLERFTMTVHVHGKFIRTSYHEEEWVFPHGYGNKILPSMDSNPNDYIVGVLDE